MKQPGPAFRRLAMLFLLARLAAPVVSVAATIWTGPVTTFTDVAGSDPTLPADQDQLTPNVWITRGLHQGIYNAKTETGFAHFFSPADTQWADGTTANYSSLSYTDWNAWAKTIHGGPHNTVGVNAVAHLIFDDIYLDINFTSWGGAGGGFSYQRSTPSSGNTPPSVSITSPANGTSFIAPANVTIQAAASDSDGTVTNVQFFDGVTSLGNATLSSYSISTNLKLGSHTLTALQVVATNLVCPTRTSSANTSSESSAPALRRPTDSSITWTRPGLASGSAFRSSFGPVAGASVALSKGSVRTRLVKSTR